MKSTKAIRTGNTKEVVCHLLRCMRPHRTIIKQCLRKEDVLYCGIICFSYTSYCTFRSISQYCSLVLYVSSFPQDVVLFFFFCSAVKDIAKNTRGPEKFHVQIFSSRKLCKKAPTNYFMKIVVVLSVSSFSMPFLHRRKSFSSWGSLTNTV